MQRAILIIFLILFGRIIWSQEVNKTMPSLVGRWTKGFTESSDSLLTNLGDKKILTLQEVADEYFADGSFTRTNFGGQQYRGQWKMSGEDIVITADFGNGLYTYTLKINWLDSKAFYQSNRFLPSWYIVDIWIRQDPI